MKILKHILVAALLALPAFAQEKPDAEGFVSLFNGKDLEGWKANEEAAKSATPVFSVADGKLVVKGGRAHLFYAGKVNEAKFQNFEFKAKVLTKKNANSGLYFHTEYQADGWPSKGYESQVNNSFEKDPRKTGSIYAIKDQLEKMVGDDEWFDYHIKVEGKKITVKINGKVSAEYEEKEGETRAKGMEGRWLKGGTFAIQAHDPGCEAHYKDIKVKPLP